MSRLSTAAALSLLAIAGACATNDEPKPFAVTTRAGNAIAANTVMQMVDPWLIGVDETDLRVPSDRGDGEDADAAPAQAPQTQ